MTHMCIQSTYTYTHICMHTHTGGSNFVLERHNLPSSVPRLGHGWCLGHLPMNLNAYSQADGAIKDST